MFVVPIIHNNLLILNYFEHHYNEAFVLSVSTRNASPLPLLSLFDKILIGYLTSSSTFDLF
jgi:hypothetical protein